MSALGSVTNKLEPTEMLVKYLNSQNIRIAKEIELPSLHEPRRGGKGPTEGCHELPLKTQLEENKHSNELQVKHEIDGIMRRNKLLLEHIIVCKK